MDAVGWIVLILVILAALVAVGVWYQARSRRGGVIATKRASKGRNK